MNTDDKDSKSSNSPSRTGHLWEHPLTVYLLKLGFQMEGYYWHPAAHSPSALKFRTTNAEFTYGFQGPEIVEVHFYKRLGKRMGVGTGFRDFIWFLFTAGKPEFGIKYLQGTVKPIPSSEPHELRVERSVEFYKRFFNGKTIGTSPRGHEIIRGELKVALPMWKRPVPEAKPYVEVEK